MIELICERADGLEPNEGISIHTPHGIHPLELGEATSQDLLLALGPPLRKFFKEDDRMERMWGGISEKGCCACS